MLITCSGLMKHNSEATVEALVLHNNLITRAKWDSFGSIIEQEGGESKVVQNSVHRDLLAPAHVLPWLISPHQSLQTLSQ